jgi:NAD(P)-dependent dehydrogenase (short-subunit alcohol dehydrogenase family)
VRPATLLLPHSGLSEAAAQGPQRLAIVELARDARAHRRVDAVAAFAPVPVIPAYSISKAAASNVTQWWRTLLAGQGVRVHAVLRALWTRI